MVEIGRCCSDQVDKSAIAVSTYEEARRVSPFELRGRNTSVRPVAFIMYAHYCLIGLQTKSNGKKNRIEVIVSIFSSPNITRISETIERQPVVIAHTLNPFYAVFKPLFQLATFTLSDLFEFSNHALVDALRRTGFPIKKGQICGAICCVKTWPVVYMWVQLSPGTR